MASTRTLSWLLIVSILLPKAAAFADFSEERPTYAVLPDVVVTAKRIPGLATKLHELPAHVTVVTAEEIARSGASTTLDVMQQLAGVSVLDSRGRGLGADGGVNLRGVVNSSRSNVLVLVDGVRQNRMTGDEVHWLAIPVDQIERLEVIRGGGGAIYGEGALTGVIHIITKRGADRPLAGEGSVEAGSHGWWRSTTSLRGTTGPIAYGIGFTRQLWDGYRDSTASRASTARLAATWTASPTTTVDITASHHEDTSHFAGGLTQATVERDRRNPGGFAGFFQEHITSLGGTVTQRLGDAWTVVANAYARRWESDSTTAGIFTNIAPAQGVGVRAAHDLGRAAWRATTVVGAELFDEKATTGLRTDVLSESNRHGGAVFIEETVKLLSRWILTAGFRYDRSLYREDLTFPTFQGKLRFNGRSPRAGITYVVNDRASLYASWARTFKAPNIDDLDAVLPPYNDNVGVQPQTADTTEVGGRWTAAPWAHLDAAVFQTRIDDEILFNRATFANENFTTRRTGAELAVRGTGWGDRVSYGATYTFVRARFDKGAFTGNVIPGTPEHTVTVMAHWRVTPWLAWGAEYLWVDIPFRVNNFANTLPADVYGVVNTTLTYGRPRHELFVTVHNLLDEEYSGFPSSAGTTVATGENPAPPRTVLVGARVKW